MVGLGRGAARRPDPRPHSSALSPSWVRASVGGFLTQPSSSPHPVLGSAALAVGPAPGRGRCRYSPRLEPLPDDGVLPSGGEPAEEPVRKVAEDAANRPGDPRRRRRPLLPPGRPGGREGTTLNPQP